MLDSQGLEEEPSPKRALTQDSEERLGLYPSREAGWAWDTHLIMYAESGESSPAFGVQVTEYTQPQTPQHKGTCVLVPCPGWVDVYLL